MGERLCANCGAEAQPEARFCRRCGESLRPPAGDEAIASGATVPVADGRRETAGLSPGDAPSVTSTDPGQEDEDPERTLVGAPKVGPPAPEFDIPGGGTRAGTPRRVEPLGEGSSTAGGAEEEDAHSHFARPARRWPVIIALCLSSLLFVAAGAWFAARYLARPARTGISSLPPATPAPPDPRQLFNDKLVEAEALLAQGDLDAALARLREANAIDPANTRARRRLGEILFETGARRAAIEEFRAVTRNAPQDFTAWRQLAAALFAERLYRDATESYRRLIALVGEQNADPQDVLSYGDALRLSGRADEARAVYERLAALPYAVVADAAGERLAAMPQPTPEPSPSPDGAADGAGERDAQASPTPLVTTPSPAPPTPPAAPSQKQPPAGDG